MIRSFILAISASATILITGCAMPQVQASVPYRIDGMRGNVSIGQPQQYTPQAQQVQYPQEQAQPQSNPCPRGIHTGWQGNRPVCQLQQAQNPQQNSNQQAAPCRSGTHQVGMQGNRRVCAPDNGQQQGSNYQPQQQNSNPSVAHPGFIAKHPGGYQYEGRTYDHQPTYRK